MNTDNAPVLKCSFCRKEIPIGVAFTPEGGEYVGHFCGLECYQRFVARAKGTATSATVLPAGEAAARTKPQI